jgi:hypothetical protein
VERQHAVGIGAQVVAALLDVGPLYRQGVDLEAVIEAKSRSHPLVVIMGRGRRAVYWCGQLVEVDWCAHPALWDFLALLAEGAKSGQGTDSFDLAGAAPRSLKDRRSRLKGLLPASLNEKICPAGRGTYTLCLGADEVCMLHYQEEERLGEVWGGEGAKP